MVRKILHQNHKHLLRILFYIFCGNKWAKFSELKLRLLRFLTKMAMISLGCNHPLSTILYHIQAQSVLADAIDRAHEIMIAESEKIHEPVNKEIWKLRRDYCEILLRQGDYASAEMIALRALNRSEGVNGWNHRTTQVFLL